MSCLDVRTLFNNVTIVLSNFHFQPQDVLAAVDKALSHYCKIDILVNSAAGNFLCPASMSFNAS